MHVVHEHIAFFGRCRGGFCLFCGDLVECNGDTRLASAAVMLKCSLNTLDPGDAGLVKDWGNGGFCWLLLLMVGLSPFSSVSCLLSVFSLCVPVPCAPRLPVLLVTTLGCSRVFGSGPVWIGVLWEQ